MARSLLTLRDISREDLFAIFERARIFKDKIRRQERVDVLRNKIVGLVFEKPSTRTRTSFEVATLRLGGGTVYLPATELQLTRGESIKDTARILGSYLDALVARVYAHQTAEELALYSGIPVINGLSDLAHPTQAVCDLITILEIKGGFDGLTLAYIGDGNNTCHSLLLGCALVGMNMNAACPDEYNPDSDVLEEALLIAAATGSRLNVLQDPIEAARGADVLYTDVWVSMGEEEEEETKFKVFRGYQINADLLKVAAKSAAVMHCLPAHRGLEITDDVLEGPQSVVWQQGENKMYGAAGILDFMLR
ncbi:MAG: ornithine carbamoyltransferase [Thermodesulfobacteriota bacterium]|nr:ornithine carbamoyltransferase [Thermodesulfobacteriota bacterium]